MSVELASGQTPGFFTSISSNGTAAGSEIVWAVSHPVDAAKPFVRLYALDPSTVDRAGQPRLLYSAIAGAWTSFNANANIVPLVANGRVYVASHKLMTIFGPLEAAGTIDAAARGGDAALAAAARDPEGEAVLAALPGHAIYGRVRAVDGSTIRLETRAGAMLSVDASEARAARREAVPVVGRALLVRGDYVRGGTFRATSVIAAKDSPALWRPDR
jgi:hypothetical protein